MFTRETSGFGGEGNALAEAKLTRYLHADYRADRFSYAVDEAAITDAERFDGKLVL
jgi:hypothetical protein